MLLLTGHEAQYLHPPSVYLIACARRQLAVAVVACSATYEVPDLERRAQQINKSVMCPVCPGESIDQSQHPLSVQMRAAVDEKLGEGWSDGQVREFFVERYGPAVLLEPPAEGAHLVAWLVPPLGARAGPRGPLHGGATDGPAPFEARGSPRR